MPVKTTTMDRHADVDRQILDALITLDGHLCQLVDQVKGLRQDLSRDHRHQQQHRAHQDDAPQWLATIAMHMAQQSFTVTMLRDLAAVHPDVAVLLDGMTNRQVGQRLHAMAGRPHGCLQLQQSKRFNGGYEWSVYLVNRLHQESGITTRTDV